MQHVAQCRAGIDAELAQTELGTARLEHVKGRLDRSAADICEAAIVLAAAEAAEVRPEGEMRVPQFEELPHGASVEADAPRSISAPHDEGVR